MRTAAGASMLRADAGLPFKDIVRAFDTFTQSVIYSLVQFNRKFNESEAQCADYNVIARGATSMVAKEVRGLQIDQLAATLTPEEKIHIDMRKLAVERMKVRDMDDMLVPEDEARRRQSAQDQAAAQQQQSMQQMAEAQMRNVLAESYKNITQGIKNAAAADANNVDTALALMESGLNAALNGGNSAQPQPSPDAPGNDPANQGPPGSGGAAPVDQAPQGGGAGGPDAGDAGQGGGMPGGM
jgi:hypothetical protein